VTTAHQAEVVARLRAAGCVFAEDEARLLMAEAKSPAELADMIARRVSGIPIEHVLGWAEFCGLRIEVDPAVFVPRRRSEFLVSEAVRRARGRSGTGAGHSPQAAAASAPGAATVVLDLCGGCGAIGVAVATALGRAELHAADVDQAAVACARRNVAAVGGHVYEGDLFAPLPADLRGRIDLLLLNAPYVPTAELSMMPAEARLYEPRIALDGGKDGVELHRRVAAEAGGWLAATGRLLIETSERQAALTADAVRSGGLTPTAVTDDDLEATVVIGTACAG
jgi:release factor glutamine methyltransferase